MQPKDATNPMSYTIWTIPQLVGYPDDYHYEITFGVSNDSVRVQVTEGGDFVSPVKAYFPTREEAEAYILAAMGPK